MISSDVYMSKKYPKRFYKEALAVKDGGRYLVHLDGRTLKTPGKLTLEVDRWHIADLIAAEWDAQEGDIIPGSMPVTRLVNVSLELTPKNRPELIKEAQAYAGTDLLCYRDAKHSALARHQDAHWNPVLDWAAGRGITLKPTHSIVAVPQDAAALEAIADYAKNLDDLGLTLFVHLTAVFGSTVLALAVMEGELSGSRAFDLSRLDADWQITHWGEDEEASENREILLADVKALCRILES